MLHYMLHEVKCTVNATKSISKFCQSVIKEEHENS